MALVRRRVPVEMEVEVQRQHLHPRNDRGICLEATKLTNHQTMYKYITRLEARLRIRQTNDSISSGLCLSPGWGTLAHGIDEVTHFVLQAQDRVLSVLAFLHVVAMEC